VFRLLKTQTYWKLKINNQKDEEQCQIFQKLRQIQI